MHNKFWNETEKKDMKNEFNKNDEIKSKTFELNLIGKNLSEFTNNSKYIIAQETSLKITQWFSYLVLRCTSCYLHEQASKDWVISCIKKKKRKKW